MQTFLPLPNFTKTAKCLDRSRLGKQRVEVLQILRTLVGATSGWSNHPAVRMWRGHEGTLILYGCAICIEWKRRGYKDSCHDKIMQYADQYPIPTPPPWIGNKAFHASHRSNLLRKNPEHYGQFGWSESQDLPYVWPV